MLEKSILINKKKVDVYSQKNALHNSKNKSLNNLFNDIDKINSVIYDP